MTRLTQALERAGLIQDPSPVGVLTGLTAGTPVDALGEFGVADAPGRSMRLPAVSTAEVPKDEPAARITALTRCPRCERVQRPSNHALGLWERILSLMRVRLYRCDFCDYRFHHFNVDRAYAVTHQVSVKALSTFLPAADDRNFSELIRDIAQAERDQQGGHDPDSYRVQGKPPVQ